jgi:hypothetical protein
MALIEVATMAHGFGMSRADAPRGPTCAALAFLRATLDSES